MGSTPHRHTGSGRAAGVACGERGCPRITSRSAIFALISTTWPPRGPAGADGDPPSLPVLHSVPSLLTTYRGRLRRDDAGRRRLMRITGSPAAHPYRLGVAIGDIATGMLAVPGMLAALLARERRGRGRAHRHRDARRGDRAAHLPGVERVLDRRHAERTRKPASVRSRRTAPSAARTASSCSRSGNDDQFRRHVARAGAAGYAATMRASPRTRNRVTKLHRTGIWNWHGNWRRGKMRSAGGADDRRRAVRRGPQREQRRSLIRNSRPAGHDRSARARDGWCDSRNRHAPQTLGNAPRRLVDGKPPDARPAHRHRDPARTGVRRIYRSIKTSSSSSSTPTTSSCVIAATPAPERRLYPLALLTMRRQGQAHEPPSTAGSSRSVSRASSTNSSADRSSASRTEPQGVSTLKR